MSPSDRIENVTPDVFFIFSELDNSEGKQIWERSGAKEGIVSGKLQQYCVTNHPKAQ